MLRAAVLALCLLPVSAWAETPTHGVVKIQTDDLTHFFQVEIADEPGEHSRGLMFRDALSENSGMLFLYPYPRPASFWMKNTKIPLDMLFIDADGRIVKIAEETTPFSLDPVSSDAPVVGILEIAGGESERKGIEVGDLAKWMEFPSKD